MEVDPAARETNFGITSPMNGHTFSLSEKDVAFAFSYTRESTDFSEHTFTIKVCRDESLTSGCIPDLSADSTGALFLPENHRYESERMPLLFVLLFTLGSFLLIGFTLASFGGGRILKTLTVPLFSLVLALIWGCTSTEEQAKDASPVLEREAMMTINDAGQYYWRVTPIKEGEAAEPSQVYTFTRVVASTMIGVNINESINIPGASSYTPLSGAGCPDFSINNSGLVGVVSLPGTGQEIMCQTTASDAQGNSVVLMLRIKYRGINFNMASYSFISFERASAGASVGTVTATVLGGGTPTYSLASCTAFQINANTGQITTSAANPTGGTRNCVVTATAGTDMNTVNVMIDVQVVCTATTLPNNADTDGSLDIDGTETDMSLVLGPVMGGLTCGGWELSLTTPTSFFGHIRTYRLLNARPSQTYSITVQTSDASIGGTFRRDENLFLNVSQGVGGLIIGGGNPQMRTSTFTTSSTASQLVILMLVLNAGATFTVTLLPN